MGHVISAKRKAQASKHAKRPHVCKVCGSTFYGNGYGNHRKKCKPAPDGGEARP